MEIAPKYKISIFAVAVFAVALLGLLRWGPSILRPQGASVPDLPAAAAAPSAEPATSTEPVATVQLYKYIEIVDGCGPYWDEGTCVNMRSGPGTGYPEVAHLRTGVVLKVAEIVESEGRQWYKISFDEGVRFPERVTGDWYVAAGEYARLFEDKGDEVSYAGVAISNSKRIVVDRSEQMLYAYDGDALFMQESISTGLEFTPTPRGTFIIYKKTPSRYMQGPIEGVSDDYYDLPGVPWDLYFTYEGAVIHGAYWHDHFGSPWSHGCVNLSPQNAKELYQWADVGTPVTVRD